MAGDDAGAFAREVASMGPGLSRVNRGSASGGSGGAEQAPKAIARPDAVAVRPGTAPGRWVNTRDGALHRVEQALGSRDRALAARSSRWKRVSAGLRLNRGCLASGRDGETPGRTPFTRADGMPRPNDYESSALTD